MIKKELHCVRYILLNNRLLFLQNFNTNFCTIISHSNYYFISILYLMWLYSKKQEWCRYFEINIFLINYTIYNYNTDYLDNFYV